MTSPAVPADTEPAPVRGWRKINVPEREPGYLEETLKSFQMIRERVLAERKGEPFTFDQILAEMRGRTDCDSD